MTMGNTSKHRLKQKDLVMNIFGLFSDEYESRSSGSIWDITIPIDEVIRYLKEKYEVSYKSNLWVWVQLKRYEEEIGVVLFKKVKNSKKNDDFSIAISYPYINFFQKQHLYVNEKIKVANGVFDKIMNHAEKYADKTPIDIFLGAGTLCFHISSILAEKSINSKTKFLIHTNNLGALSQLMDPGINHENIEVTLPEGRVDPTTHTIIGENTEYYNSVKYDFIIQGTSCIFNGELYIESREERIRKETILHDTTGQKILVLTKHEFSDKPLEGTDPYGKLSDYDYIIVPVKNADSHIKNKYEKLFDEFKKEIEPEIKNWNYEIFKIQI